MRIVFVRHGHPDYKLDCLTELGHKHAEAAAKRLADERPAAIYASTMGRAQQTARHIADELGMDIISVDYMREINWGSPDGEPILKDGHPWLVADAIVAEGEDITAGEWEKIPAHSGNKVIASVQKAADGFDSLLSSLGVLREGLYYRVTRKNDDTVFMVSHGGSSSAVLSHMLNIPFPQFCATIRPKFTAITIVTLEGNEGELITPHVELMNDARHIVGID